MLRIVAWGGMIGAFVATTALVPAAQAQYPGSPPGYYPPSPGYHSYRDRYGYRAGHVYPAGYRDRHHRCRGNGTGGAILGAIAGGLLGGSIAGYRDRAAGTVFGGVGGALAGRAIDRDC